MLEKPTVSAPSLMLLKTQRSHVVFVLSNVDNRQESVFLDWYQGTYRQTVLSIPGVLKVQHYEKHEVDITRGQHLQLPYQYLGMYDISIDGAEGATALIESITSLHRAQPAARPPATWLYYPVSERVGRSPAVTPSLLTLAFANAVPGQEAEFREWYATRHIRHALNISALVSGQCYERTNFQRYGALPVSFNTIAVYEQEGTPQSIIESFASLPESTFAFPMLDLRQSRFSEAVYRPL
jgi:hypothetical protein